MEKTKGSKTQIQKVLDIATPDQVVSFMLTIGITSFLPWILRQGIAFAELRNLERPDFNSPCVEDLYYIPLYALFIKLWKTTVINYSAGYFTSKMSTKYSGEVLEMKVAKCCRGLFKVMYFGCTFIGAWKLVIPDTNYSPELMLGSGDERLIISDYPYTEIPKYLKFYYLCSLSYYVEDLLVHVLQSPSSDYFEMILHHLVTIELIVLSYLCGFWTFGIWILMQMDLADIFIGLIRVVMDFCKSYITVLIYLCILYSFVKFRLIAFVKLILINFTFNSRVAVDSFADTITIASILLS
jgi:hypothetical protein